MTRSSSILRASPGDRVLIHGHLLGEPERDGEVLEVLGEHGAPPYLVRWEDGRVSTLYPSSDASIQHFADGADEAGGPGRRGGRRA